MRNGLALTTLVVGITLAMVSYLLLAAPLGQPLSESYSNPKVSFAPLLFLLGVLLAFLSAVVYELLPEARRR